MNKLILDSSKIAWHQDRIKKFKAGERFYPITIDMALSKACPLECEYCFAQLQENDGYFLSKDILTKFINDCAKMKVRGISLVSDGESTCNPNYVYFINYAKEKGIDVALGTNGVLLDDMALRMILPSLTYIRFNISGYNKRTYHKIHGGNKSFFDRLIRNIKYAVEYKKRENLAVTIGMQMVLLPKYKKNIIPLAKLAIELGVDYLIIKHCSDDENSSLGVDYSKYIDLEATLKESEKLSTDKTLIQVKWSKIKTGRDRTYKKCYGTPFHLQISGSGLVAPCGGFFNPKYKQFHIGNFAETSFYDLVHSDKYWEIMNYLKSDEFNAVNDCACLCLQHHTNTVLDNYMKLGIGLNKPKCDKPEHINFI